MNNQSTVHQIVIPQFLILGGVSGCVFNTCGFCISNFCLVNSMAYWQNACYLFIWQSPE